MKKLLAGGVPRLYQLAGVFRTGARTALQHPEFTMLEWYRSGVGYEAVMQDCAVVLGCAGGKFRRGEATCDASELPVVLTVAEAFDRFAQVDVFAPDLAVEARRIGVDPG